MNAHVLQENFLRALTRVGRIVSTRAQLPILQNVKLVAKKDGLEITTTNLESSETIWVGGKVEKEGELCVPARVLIELVTTFPADTVHLVSNEETLSVTCAKFKASLPGVSAKEFPQVTVVDKKEATKIEKSTLTTALSNILFSAATDEGRPILTGVKIKQEDDAVVFAATDGYRLSLQKLSTTLTTVGDVIVPARTLVEVIKIAHEEKEEEFLYIGKTKEGQIGFVVGDTAIITRLLDGEFPNFDRIIPKTHTTRALIDKESFFRAVRSAAIFARDNANIVKIVLDKQKITVSANAPSIGENVVELEAKIDGDGGEIAFNSRFLVDFLGNFSGEEFVFEMTGALNPGVFRASKDESFLHIIMPVRLQG